MTATTRRCASKEPVIAVWRKTKGDRFIKKIIAAKLKCKQAVVSLLLQNTMYALHRLSARNHYARESDVAEGIADIAK